MYGNAKEGMNYIFYIQRIHVFFKRLIPNGISQYNMHLSISKWT